MKTEDRILALNELLLGLIHQVPSLAAHSVIPWGCPVPTFGDITTAAVATLGLNPSNREFVDGLGNELEGRLRRLETLRSLGIKRWDSISGQHLKQISDSCRFYFAANPYLGWFSDLEDILATASVSYFGEAPTACHLDLIPYATTCKWTELTVKQRSTLLERVGDILGRLLCLSSVRVMILNGMTVVRNFQVMAGMEFDRYKMQAWTLPRSVGSGVAGVAFRGIIREIGGVRLREPVTVLGYNHNIQSSFGVTNKVKAAIRAWVGEATNEVLGERQGQRALA